MSAEQTGRSGKEPCRRWSGPFLQCRAPWPGPVSAAEHSLRPESGRPVPGPSGPRDSVPCFQGAQRYPSRQRAGRAALWAGLPPELHGHPASASGPFSRSIFPLWPRTWPPEPVRPATSAHKACTCSSDRTVGAAVPTLPGCSEPNGRRCAPGPAVRQPSACSSGHRPAIHSSRWPFRIAS